MKLNRRDALAAAAYGLMLPAAVAVASTEGSPNPATRRALEAAVDAFFAGWASGDWSAFLDGCDEAMTFQFPVGEQGGRHAAPQGKRALAAWAAAHQRQGNRITESAVDLKLFAGDWVVICDRGSGTIGGTAYTGLHALFMRAGPNGKLMEFREYFGEIAG